MLRRGEIWWVRLDPVLGSEVRKTRPCLVLSTDVVNERRRTVVVISLQTHRSLALLYSCQSTALDARQSR